MKSILYKSEERGRVNFGWLDARHTFSFGSWYNPERLNFGSLRVLNNDIIAPGTGFDTHPHRDMEIITIPLKGAVKHKDSTGGEGFVEAGEVQVMSAGTGVFHSEFNASEKDLLELFQIWIIPENIGIKPRYDQKRFDWQNTKNTWQTVVSGQKNTQRLWINQKAELSLTLLEKDKILAYNLSNKTRGVFLQLILGKIQIGQEILAGRDALGIWEIEEIQIKALENSQILAIEVEMLELW